MTDLSSNDIEKNNEITSDDNYSQFISVETMQVWNSIYEELTDSFSIQIGKNTSKKEREQLKLSDSTLTYGEISFPSFATALLKIKYKYGRGGVGHSPPGGVLQRDGGIFVDLGSGTGKGIVAASIIHNFDTCYGVEILEGLHTLAVELISNWNGKGKGKIETLGRKCYTLCNVYHGDMLNLKYKDWRNADVVFANSTCFDENLMLKIADIAQGMKKGSFFITFTRPIPGEDFEILEYGLHQMSWGLATVYIHQKINNPTS